ncbi:MAG TPA: PilZ domain-containing protein [Sphingobium sp.]|nr:PilZ domain-containing protein [Sphingobium sp.]
MPQSQFDTETRGAPREQIDIQSQIWGATLSPTPARIVNISPQGCMLRCDAMMAMGDHLSLDLPQLGAMRATVMWSLSGRLGVQFETPIDVDNYLELLDSLGSPPEGPALL